MSKYEIMRYASQNSNSYFIRDAETYDCFGGYDDMGGVNWTNNLDAYKMDKQEALQIKADLESADMEDTDEEDE